MIAVKLNINEKAYEKIMYILNSLPKSDVKIVHEQKIEEIDPKKLSQNDFDYISPDRLKEIDGMIEVAKKEDLNNLKSFDELKNEL